MTDVHDSKTRSKNMAAVKNAGTKPELVVQTLLTDMEIHFACQDAGVPGKPDFFLPDYNTAVFVHGCYWHGHNCHLFKTPQTRTEFWLNKINQNRERDKKVGELLTKQQIRNLKIWECALRGKQKLNRSDLSERIEEFLLSGSPQADISHAGFSLQP